MPSILAFASAFIVLCIVYFVSNIVRQLIFTNENGPPIVFHWIPWLGSAVTYGKEPYKFLFAAQARYGDVFTFILLGRKVTVHLGVAGA